MAADERVANLLGALSHSLADRTAEAIRDATDLPGSDAAVLVALHGYAEGEPLDVLRRALGLSQPGTVRVVDRLEQRGLVQRGRATADGRTVGLRLTRAGRRAAREVLAARQDLLVAALDALGAQEREVLADLLGKLLAGETSDRDSARWICRLCDGDACGHPTACPVTLAVR